jgi:F0F1-type ATP synthase assembly protein I
VKRKEGIFPTETMSKMLIEIVSKTLIATNIGTLIEKVIKTSIETLIGTLISYTTL